MQAHPDSYFLSTSFIRSEKTVRQPSEMTALMVEVVMSLVKFSNFGFVIGPQLGINEDDKSFKSAEKHWSKHGRD